MTWPGDCGGSWRRTWLTAESAAATRQDGCGTSARARCGYSRLAAGAAHPARSYPRTSRGCGRSLRTRRIRAMAEPPTSPAGFLDCSPRKDTWSAVTAAAAGPPASSSGTRRRPGWLDPVRDLARHPARAGLDAGTAWAQPDAGAARAELARRWLLTFGPAPVADLQWWAGWTGGQTKAALAALDPTPMGWQARDWFLGEHRDALFDRTGNIGPTVWWAGKIIGGWAQRPSGEVVCRLLEDAGSEAAAAVASEAVRLESWLGQTRVTPRFRTPLERALAAAGVSGGAR